MAAVAQMLADGKRLHLHHGPIDLIIQVFGSASAITAAYAAARRRFATVLDDLVGELAVLRCEVTSDGLPVNGAVAARMVQAVRPHHPWRITPMAAVAGAVADEIMAAMTEASRFERAYVNNGGDIALFISAGTSFTAASAAGPVTVRASDPIRGIATSGWRGRSFSLGIADSVTVLAATAAAADAAATLIANAVDLPGSRRVTRQSASEIAPDSDLKERLVTVAVAPLDADDVAAALLAGRAVARDFVAQGHICAASLLLQGETCYVGNHVRQIAAATRRESVHA
jgi:ApbE superfamily uncharacterized protein (UPF0280 family)